MTVDREWELEVLRGLSPTDKLSVMQRLIQQAYDLRTAAVRAEDPTLTDEEVRARVRELTTGGRP